MSSNMEEMAHMTSALVAAMEATEPIGRQAMIIMALLPDGHWAKVTACLPENREEVMAMSRGIDNLLGEEIYRESTEMEMAEPGDGLKGDKE